MRNKKGDERAGKLKESATEAMEEMSVNENWSRMSRQSEAVTATSKKCKKIKMRQKTAI